MGDTWQKRIVSSGKVQVSGGGGFFTQKGYPSPMGDGGGRLKLTLVHGGKDEDEDEDLLVDDE
jgi:hypothetical protein